MALLDGQFSLGYINTKANVWADGLSRGEMRVANELVSMGYKRIFIPEEGLEFILDIDI